MLFFFFVWFAAVAAVRNRGSRGFARSSSQTQPPELSVPGLLRLSQGFVCVEEEGQQQEPDEERAELISHILCLQQRVEQTDQELALPPGNASCQTTPWPILGLQLGLLDELEGGASCDAGEAPFVLELLSITEIRQQLEFLLMRAHDHSA